MLQCIVVVVDEILTVVSYVDIEFYCELVCWIDFWSVEQNVVFFLSGFYVVVVVR